MARENQLDGNQIPLRLPYDTLPSPIAEIPRFRDGLNMQVTTGGFLKKRGGMPLVTGTGDLPAGRVVERLFSYTTMEATPKTYIMASARDTSTGRYSLYYTRPATPTAWTEIPDYRDIRESTLPHEMQESRGLLYVKGFPQASSAEKLGTIIFDGTDLSVKPWGALGPDTPARMSNQYRTTDPEYSVWTPSAHPFSVNTWWEYTYAYESVTGHVTNRAQIETNRDKPASRTGPFSNLKPRVVVKVPSDVVNFPKILMFRTPDGGGIWYKVGEIDVTSETPDSNITFEDNGLISGVVTGPATTTLVAGINASVGTITLTDAVTFPYFGSFAIKIGSEYMLVTGIAGAVFTVTRGFAGTTAASHSAGATIEYLGLDPLPDSLLDRGTRAPSLTSNSPPPTGLAEEDFEVGVDPPQPSTPIVKFAGRLWYGIGNVLFYSALEELDIGKPEEAWPSGLRGNFFRLQEPLVALAATSESLYIFTTRKTYWLKGFDKPTFSIQPLFSDVGAKQAYGVSVKGDVVYWVSNNNRIFRAEDNRKEPIGDPLGDELESKLSPSNGVANMRLYMASYQKGPIDWVVLQVTNLADANLTRTYVFDLQQEGLFWQVPWTFPVSCITSGQLLEADTKDFLIGASWNRGNNRCNLVNYNDASVQDYVHNGAVNYAVKLTSSLFGFPTGNNLNTYKKPTFTPTFYAWLLIRKKFVNDTQPTVRFFVDSTAFSVPGGTPYEVARRTQQADFPLYKYSDNIYRQLEKIGIEIEKEASAESFEIHELRTVWEYTGGTGQ